MSTELGRIELVPILVGLALAVLPTAIMFVYALGLKRAHQKLRAKIEEQLAETRATEKALRDSEVFYHSLVESLPQSILRKDVQGLFTFCNRNFSNELGKSPEEVLGKDDFAFFPPELAAKYRDDDAAVMEANQPLETIEEHATPGGKLIYVHVIKIPIRDANGAVIGIQGIFSDVTERKQAEEQLQAQNLLLREMASSERRAHEDLKVTQSRLVQAEKLAGLGQMVAGVAHEINNPLAFVSNNVAVLQRDLTEVIEVLNLYKQGEAVLSSLEPALIAEIEDRRDRADLDYTLGNLPRLLDRTRDGLGRIQQIVKDLRVFARLDEGILNEVDLNEGVSSTITIVQGHAKKKKVQIEKDLGPLPAMTCYGAKLNQVVMNLVMNAIDACPDGGTVTVRTRAETDGVRLDVIDTGIGIEPEIRERIFDPFFTTKPVGVGTGLGLSISYGIVQDHGGKFEVDSTPGQGSRFTVRLPTSVGVAT